MTLVAVAVVRSVKCANGSNWLDGEKERKKALDRDLSLDLSQAATEILRFESTQV